MSLLSRALRVLSFGVVVLSLLLTFTADAKSKRRKRKITKRPKMVEAMVKNQSALDNAELSARVDEKRRQRREQMVKVIVGQLKKAKTIKDLVEKAPKKYKVKRRYFFGKDFAKSAPYAIADGQKLHLFSSRAMKNGVTVSFYQRSDGRDGIKVRGRDITPKKRESDRRWMKRVAKVLKAKPRARKRKRKSALLELLEWMLPRAFAAEGDPAYLPALYLAYETLSGGDVQQFISEYAPGLRGNVFNDIQRYWRLDQGALSSEDQALISTERICFSPPEEDLGNGASARDVM
ncbi:MAG: hypothetical protein AAF202_01165 [Pseudomonadota bacterium]